MDFEKVKQKILMEKVLNEDFFKMIQRNMKPYEEMMSRYRCAIMEIETKFNVLNEQFSLEYDRNPIETIKSRLKSTEGITRKMQKKGLSMDLAAIEENISDIAGVRVICSFPEDIYLLADCLLAQDDIRLIEKKDYISNPKPGGYRSLHLIVEIPIFLSNEKRLMKVEVQLRTIAMDFWASLEHKLRYKKEIDPKIADSLAKELAECAEISASLDRRMEQIRNGIAKEEI